MIGSEDIINQLLHRDMGIVHFLSLLDDVLDDINRADLFSLINIFG